MTEEMAAFETWNRVSDLGIGVVIHGEEMVMHREGVATSEILE